MASKSKKAVQAELRARTFAWVQKNRELYEAFEHLALQEAAAGRQFGWKAIAEQCRRGVQVPNRPDNTGFKICNTYITYIGQMLVDQHPHLSKFVAAARKPRKKARAAKPVLPTNQPEQLSLL